MRRRSFFRGSFFGHNSLVVVFLEGKRHPEMWVGVERLTLCGQLRLEFAEQRLQERGGKRERAERCANLRDVLRKILHRSVVSHLLELHRVATGVDRNQTILVKLFHLPLILCRHGPQRGKDVRRVVACLNTNRRYKHLVAPKNRASALAHSCIARCLPQHRLEHCDGRENALHSQQPRELDSRLVIVFSAWQRRQPGALARCVVQSNRFAPTQQLSNVDS
mmetsp:Transcript_63569/g.105715  ORF Transcript_63569/g.105715 Transcript_63569/m.105715 type:complete len:221 (+) Transcript_63569:1000-1662(+)